MWFRLAALWGCTVAEAQRRCSVPEFVAWCAYYNMEPFGAHAEWSRHAINTACILAPYKKVDPDKFMPKATRAPQQMGRNQMMATARAFIAQQQRRRK